MSLHTSLARLLAGSVVATVALVAAPTPAPAASPATTYAADAFAATNSERAERNLVKLKRDKCLQRLANKQAKKMAAEGRLSHQSLETVQQKCGMGFAGENVAYGLPDGEAVVATWMSSPPHRANILRRQYRLMAVAARKADGYWWVAQVFGRKR